MSESHDRPEIIPANSSLGPGIAVRDGTPALEAGRPAKKRRINFACNYCRNRKTRCDEQKPSCMACINAGVECVTTDRRRPGVEVSRRETQRRASRASTSSLATPSSSRKLHSSPVTSQDAGVSEHLLDNASASPQIGCCPKGGLGYDDDLRNRPGHTVTESTASVPTSSVFVEDDARPAGPECTKLPVFLPSRGSN